LLALLAIGVTQLTGCETPTKATVSTARFAVAPGSTGWAAAFCPGSSRAVGGGVIAEGTRTGIVVEDSGPLDETGTVANTVDGDVAKYWYGAAYDEANTAKSVRVFALCSDTSTATIETSGWTLGGDEQSAISVTCPAGKRALGGGIVETNTLGDVTVAASGPLSASGTIEGTNDGDSPTRWYAAVYNNVPTERNVRVSAICSNSTATIESTAFSLAAQSSGARTATCPSSKRALGGGVVQGGPDALTLVHDSGPLDDSGSVTGTSDGDTATQWYSMIENYDHLAHTFKAYAICE
jgi:hypothetical protein